MSNLLPSESARFEEICRLGIDRIEPLADTIARAFADDPIWRWIYHGNQDPLTHEDALVLARYLLADMSPIDEVHGFRHHHACALWHAPLVPANKTIVAAHKEAPSPYGDAFVDKLSHRLPALGELTTKMAEHRPEEPHWYLGILATHPSRQSQGLGGRVLAAMHERCDELAIPCFLESSNPQNYGFYRRHGYVETSEFSAADSPPLLGFWRTPR